MQPLKTNKLSALMSLALNVLALDGGFVIAIQIFSFLLTYFFVKIPSPDAEIQSLNAISKSTIAIAFISTINLAAILYRLAGIAHGLKHRPLTCYKQALRRLPMLILLYLTLGFILISLVVPGVKLLATALHLSFTSLMFVLILALLPYGVISCISLIYEQKSPIRALVTTFQTVRYRLSINLLAVISVLYALPACIRSFTFFNIQQSPYLGLFAGLWFLFCHTLTIVSYLESTSRPDPESAKKAKVIII